MKLDVSERGHRLIADQCRVGGRQAMLWGLGSGDSRGAGLERSPILSMSCETARCLDLEKCCLQQVTGFMPESGRRPPAPGQPRAPESLIYSWSGPGLEIFESLSNPRGRSIPQSILLFSQWLSCPVLKSEMNSGVETREASDKSFCSSCLFSFIWIEMWTFFFFFYDTGCGFSKVGYSAFFIWKAFSGFEMS